MKSTTSNALDEMAESLNKLLEQGLSKNEISEAAGVNKKCLNNLLGDQPECSAETLIKFENAVEYLNEEAIYRVGVLELLFETIENGVRVSRIVDESGLPKSIVYRIIKGSKPRGPTLDKLYDGCMAIAEKNI